jgi:lysophospholipase L1-like esterase
MSSPVCARACAATLAFLTWSALAPVPASAADEARPCRTQADIARFSQPLARVADRLARHKPLKIVALGSSSTAGAGASSPAGSYPARLAALLQKRFPGEDITVVNRGVNGEEAREMLARLEDSVLAENPDLVLWQVGTNSVLRDQVGTDVGLTIRDGLARLKSSGADVVLIDPQFAPKVLAKAEAEHMVNLIAAMAKEANVDLFPRFAVMRRWHQTESIPFDAFVSPDGLHMNDWSYSCVAQLLGDSIAEAATRHQAVAGTLAPSVRPAP